MNEFTTTARAAAAKVVSDPDYLVAVAAIFGATAGPFIAYACTRRAQRHADIFDRRQIWIATLREKVSELVAVSNMVTMDLGSDPHALMRAVSDYGERICRLKTEIALLLNTAEFAHSNLLRLLQEYPLIIGEFGEITAKNQARFRGRLAEQNVAVEGACRLILKVEWDRSSKTWPHRCCAFVLSRVRRR